MRQGAFLVLCLVLLINNARSQCASRDTLLKTIAIVELSTAIKNNGKIQTLSDYEKNPCYRQDDSLHAFLLKRIGRLYYLDGNFNLAVDYTNSSIAVIRKSAVKFPQNLVELAACYYNLQIYYDSLGNSRRKIESMDSCIATGFRHGNSLKAFYTLLDKVQYLFSTGDYEMCIKTADVFEKWMRKYYPDSLNQISSIVVYKVDALLLMGKIEEAEKIVNFQTSELEGKNFPNNLGVMYNLSGIAAEYTGKYQEAIRYLQKSIKTNQKIPFLLGVGESLNRIGIVYNERLHDYGKAIYYSKQALNYVTDASSVWVINNIANIYVERKMFDSAFYFFQLAFGKIRPGISEKDLLNQSLLQTVTDKLAEYVTALVIDKGNAYFKKFRQTNKKEDLKNAINVFKVADRLLTELKIIYPGTGSKLFWSSHSRRLYENAVESCFLADDRENAFYFFEKSRALLLSEQLHSQHWLAQREIDKQANLQSEIVEKEKALEQPGLSADDYNKLQRLLFDKRLELDQFYSSIKGSNPLYYQNFLEKSFISLTDVQQKILKDHQAFLELFSGEQDVYLLMITPGTTLLRKLQKSIFDSLSSVYKRYISNPVLLNRDYNGFINSSNQLYNLIFEKVALPQGRIIISPDGQYFPFESLITDLKSRRYFLQHYAVSYTYSARYLLNEFNNNTISSEGEFLGIAPVQYSNGFAALAGSDQSLDRMKNYFTSSRNLISGKATKKNFLNEFYNYRIVQLYTHATDSGENGEPMIYFNDSALALSELFYGKQPSINIVVLSACETGLGKFYVGEGVFSFNRGFAALGIPSAISNLWQVDNQATYKITELFYKYVSKGRPLDVALQLAKKEFIETSSLENKLPYYWAAPILVGQSGKITLHQSSWKWMIIPVILLLLAFWLERKPFNSVQDTKEIAA